MFNLSKYYSHIPPNDNETPKVAAFSGFWKSIMLLNYNIIMFSI
jgi:hypothetical protein